MSSQIWNRFIAGFFILCSLVTLFWWIPADTETGLIIIERRSTEIGDALAPTMSAIGILIVCCALFVSSFFERDDLADAAEKDTGVALENVKNLGTVLVIIAVAMVLMVHTGPLVVDFLNAQGLVDKVYRHLSDTVPYKYIGFALGGFVLVCGLISWVQGKISWQAAATAVAAVLGLILVYDVPFDTLLLPPNGSLE